MMLTHARLLEVLRYNKRTGIFVRRVSTSPNARKGGIAGCPRPDGYKIIHVDGRKYRTARLAWFYVKGKWPTGEVDHRNHNTADDRFVNLRDVTNQVNQQNQIKAKVCNKTGLLGVYAYGTEGKFKALIKMPKGKTKHLGTFDTPEQAHAAYVKAKRIHHVGNTL